MCRVCPGSCKRCDLPKKASKCRNIPGIHTRAVICPVEAYGTIYLIGNWSDDANKVV